METTLTKQQPLLRLRTHQIMGKNERLRIQVDGKEIGDIGNYDELRIPVPFGLHEIFSHGFWREKAYPQKFMVNNFDDVEITIEPTSRKIKYQFYVETPILFMSQVSEFSLRSRRIAWDMRNNDLFIRKVDRKCVYFDLDNFAYQHPLRFMFNIDEQNLTVYANRKQDILLYESIVDVTETGLDCWTKVDKFRGHSFYRWDGSLLGHLYQECGNWFISGQNKKDKLAVILHAKTQKKMFLNQDYLLRLLVGGESILAYHKWVRSNILQFRNANLPPADYHEVLMLGFITFAVLSGNEEIKKAIDDYYIKAENHNRRYI